MELATIITLLVTSVAFFANAPLETPVQAIGAAFAVGFSAFLGGASFLALILDSATGWRQQTAPDILSEHYYQNRPRESYERVIRRHSHKLNDHDLFYRRYGVCCNAEGKCVSCLDIEVDRIRRG
ncbi:hypothetical protein FSARC_2945 [Fusarium sarcochroum]|uniref:Uncharacterized protein n=1 Tax=Fusarium sarcochroum TaxID=1208366 RepID=A0A8H4U5D3_9HYPO|nr:hypothetical protein FSARC_2945 [Fusarium sarcochroum]